MRAMKRAIEWVDTVRGDGVGRILPSELLNLVQEVRREALETVELFVRKQGTFAEGSDSQMNQTAWVRGRDAAVEHLRWIANHDTSQWVADVLRKNAEHVAALVPPPPPPAVAGTTPSGDAPALECLDCGMAQRFHYGSAQTRPGPRKTTVWRPSGDAKGTK